MIGFRRSIYWKLLFTILICFTVSSLVVGSMFLIFIPRVEMNPQIKKGLIGETHKIADRINLHLQTSSAPLDSIIKEVHEKDNVSIRVFDAQGSELATYMIDKLKKTNLISPSIIEDTFRDGDDFQIILSIGNMWTYVVSVPLAKAGEPTGILQIYYPHTKGAKGIMQFSHFQVYVPILIIAVLTALLSRLLTRPIRELTKATKKMSRGNLGVRVKVRSKDEIGQLGKTFNEMSQRLADFQKSRRELLADISHEIRSPLARIQSDAEILIDRKVGKEEREQHLKAICEEVKDIDKLVEDLSILSRLEYHQLEMEVSPSSIQDALSQEISKFRLQLEKKDINLKQTIPENIPLVMMDTLRIGQIISNLLTNALRYTPKGGTVDIGLKKKDSMVEVWVKDTGPGIPQEELPYIFERFYRVDKSRSRTSGGTGLGLAIAKYFVDAQGGYIHAESEVGKGTCITFSIPIAC
ncbi:MAG: HAMP domain-containing protein [Deltaproteobacteria bacterium]|nr:HAMP domain-containing protein [Deltaproteobacteria bacterium]